MPSRVEIDVVPNVKNFARDVDAGLRASLGRLAATSRKLGADIALGIGLGLSAITAKLKDVITTTAEFDSTSRKLSAVLKSDAIGKATANMTDLGSAISGAAANAKELTQAALGFGPLGAVIKDSLYTTQQLEQGFLELAKAGITTAADVKNLIDPILSFATGAGLDIGTATNNFVRIIEGLNLPFTKAADLADTLTAAANATTIDINELADGIRYSGAQATNAGIKYDELIATLSVLRDGGLRATQAGRLLATALASLQAPTVEAQKIIDRLGISFTQNTIVNGKTVQTLKPIPEILDQLTKSGATAEDIVRLFGKESLKVVETLLRVNDAGQSGADTIRDLTAQIDKSAGAAGDYRKAIQDGPEGAFIRLKNLGPRLITIFGQGLTQALGGVARQILAVGDSTAVLDRIQALGASTVTLLDSLLKLFTASYSTGALEHGLDVIDSLIKKGAGFVDFLTNLETKYRVLAGAMAGMATSFGLLGAAQLPILGRLVPTFGPLLGILAGITLASADTRKALLGFFHDIRDTVGPIFKDLLPVLDTLAKLVGSSLSAAFKDLEPFLVSVASSITTIVKAVSADAGPVLSALGTAFGELTKGGAQFLTALTPALVGLVDAFAGIIRQAPALVTAFAPLFAVIPDVIGLITSVFAGIGGQAGGITGGIKDLTTTIAGLIHDFITIISPIIGPVVSGLLSVGKALLGIFDDVKTPLLEAIKSLVGLLPDLLTSVAQLLPQLTPLLAPLTTLLVGIAALLPKLVPVAADLIAGLLAIVTPLIEMAPKVLPVLDRVVSAVSTGLGPAFRIVGGIAMDLINGLTTIASTLSTVLPSALGGLSGVASGLATLLGSTFVALSVPLSALLVALSGIITDLGPKLLPALKPIADELRPVVDTLTKLITAVITGAGALVGPLGHDIAGVIDDIRSVVENLAGHIVDLEPAFAGFLDAIKEAFDTIKGPVNDLVDALARAMPDALNALGGLASTLAATFGGFLEILAKITDFLNWIPGGVQVATIALVGMFTAFKVAAALSPTYIQPLHLVMKALKPLFTETAGFIGLVFKQGIGQTLKDTGASIKDLFKNLNQSATAIGVSVAAAVVLVVAAVATYIQQIHKIRQVANDTITGINASVTNRKTFADLQAQVEKLDSVARNGVGLNNLQKLFFGGDERRVKDAAAATRDRTEAYIAQIQRLAAQLGITNDEATQLFSGKQGKAADDYAAQIQNLATKYGITNAAAAGIISSTDQVGEHFDAAAELANRLQSNIDKIFGKAPAVGQRATDQYANSVEALQKQLKESTTSVVGDSKANRDNRSQVDQVVQSILDEIQVRSKLGATTKEINDILVGHVGHLKEVLQQSGLTKEQVDKYIDSLNLTPKNIETFIQTAGLDKVQTQIDDLTSQLKGINDSVTVAQIQAKIKAGDLEAAQKLIDDFKNQKIGIQIDTSGLGVLTVEMQRIANLKAYNSGQQLPFPSVGFPLAAVAAPPAAGSTTNPFNLPPPSSGGSQIFHQANGGILRFFANGGVESHIANIFRGGPTRVFNEPETGGEAYIPLGRNKRARSMAIWNQVGDMFGASQGGGGVTVDDLTLAFERALAKQGGKSVQMGDLNMNVMGGPNMSQRAAQRQLDEIARRVGR